MSPTSPTITKTPEFKIRPAAFDVRVAALAILVVFVKVMEVEENLVVPIAETEEPEVVVVVPDNLSKLASRQATSNIESAYDAPEELAPVDGEVTPEPSSLTALLIQLEDNRMRDFAEQGRKADRPGIRTGVNGHFVGECLGTGVVSQCDIAASKLKTQ